MRTVAGVGHSRSRNSFGGGSAAAKAAVDRIGRRPDLVVVFATSGHDQQALLAGVREITGPAPLVGCSAEGVISQLGSDESSHAVAVLAMASERMRFHTFDLAIDRAAPRRCGAELARQVAAHAYESSDLLLLFPDGLFANCTELITGLEQALPRSLTIAGGTAGEMLKFERTHQYFDDRVSSGHLSAVLITGVERCEIGVSHGCELFGIERTVTRSEDCAVQEVDGRPAWAVFKEYLSKDEDQMDGLDVAQLAVGQRLPEATPGYGEHIIRNPLRLDKETGDIFFPGALPQGTKFHAVRRDPDRVRFAALESAEQIARAHPDEQPALVFQFDCAGRGRLLFGDDVTKDLIEPAQRVLGKEVPWIGFHTYGEIAPIGRRTHFHNLTVVFCALYEG